MYKTGGGIDQHEQKIKYKNWKVNDNSEENQTEPEIKNWSVYMVSQNVENLCHWLNLMTL